jgi:cysteine desulfurase
MPLRASRRKVLDAMLPFLRDHWGNPSSAYSFGHQLTEALDRARASVADLIKAEPRQIIFTSCGTESNNSAFHSALASQPGKRHIVTTAVEHSANIKFSLALQKQGCTVTFLPVDSEGLLDLKELERAIQPDTALVSVMAANNETGVVFPVQETAHICQRKGVLFHTDAVQAAGKLTVDVQDSGVDFLSLSGHKLHAPKGVGALFVKRPAKYQPYVIGGGQERGRRGGTRTSRALLQ